MDLFTIQTAAPELRVSEATLRRFVSRNEIGYRRIGRRYLFRREDIDRFLESNYQPPKIATQGSGHEAAL